MMGETSKTWRIWTDAEKALLTGSGIDIGCGPDPVLPTVRKFDIEDGDANHITRYVHEQFDFVFSSHCLEHMHDPRAALHEWWQLVKPGGHLIFLVPDEDLYEQGVWPSRFNWDHKATFTIYKERSWSPVSINVRDLVGTLPDAELVSLTLQDHGYDHSLLRHGPMPALPRFIFRVYHGLRRRRLMPPLPPVETWEASLTPVAQTWRGALCQIQCILRKRT